MWRAQIAETLHRYAGGVLVYVTMHVDLQRLSQSSGLISTVSMVLTDGFDSNGVERGYEYEDLLTSCLAKR